LIEYSFSESPLEQELSYAYEPFLFHRPAHLHLQSPENWFSYYAISSKRKLIDAHLHVNITGHLAVSPLRAPFGSFQCTRGIRPVVLYNFLEFTVARLKENQVQVLELKSPPLAYEPGSMDLITTFLLNIGFEVIVAEAGAYLNVPDNFRAGLNEWELRKIKQSEQAGLTFQVLPVEELESLYSFILGCRIEREYELGIDWETLRKTVKTFPERFFLFGVMHEGVLVAASIAINVGNGVMYNFHSAHPKDYDHLSPVVLLLEGMVTYCRNNDYRILDLGTSAIEGSPNFGLLDFKLGLGATATTKFTFRKQW
jgi:Acetyltransferase (GNAT) domain